MFTTACGQASPDAMSEAPPPASADSATDSSAGRQLRRWTPPATRRQRTGFARSRFVGTMKYILPTLAVALLVLVAVWPQLATQEDRFHIDFTAISANGAARPQALNARLLGVDSAARPFTITADVGTLARNEDGAEVYLLDQPKGDMVLEDGSWVVVTARDGRYVESTRYLHLWGAVSLFHDGGYEFHTESGRFKLDDHTGAGEEPVAGQGPFGTINSEGFRILDGGDRIQFTGKATMKLYRQGQGS